MSHAIRGGRRVRAERAWGPLGPGELSVFLFTFPAGYPASMEQAGTQAKGAAQDPAGQQDRERRGERCPGFGTQRAGERAATPTRPPELPCPTPRRGHATAAPLPRTGTDGPADPGPLHNLPARRPGPPREPRETRTRQQRQDFPGNAPSPPPRARPRPAALPALPPPPRRPRGPARQASANAGRAPGPFPAAPAAATLGALAAAVTHPRPPRLPASGSVRLGPRRRLPPRPGPAPRRALPSDQRRSRRSGGREATGGRARAGGGRAWGRIVPAPRRRLLRRRLPSSGLCCNVCEADFERLARRPPAAALLPPPPSPPRPSPSPRRPTPFSSSAKFLNPFLPLPPIVSRSGGSRAGPGRSRELRSPLWFVDFLLACSPGGSDGAAGPGGSERTASPREGLLGAPGPSSGLPALSSRLRPLQAPGQLLLGTRGSALGTQAECCRLGRAWGPGRPRVPAWVLAP